jgi:hypothetical protein
MIEQIVLGAFLVLPLIIVAFLFTDELWQDHRLTSHERPTRTRERNHWRPLRLRWHYHSRGSRRDR